MRFFRLFWIPDGLTARDGTYVNERWEDLMRILALESVRGQFLVVGEDLGTVPDVREALADYGMLRYRLFYFEKGTTGCRMPPRATTRANALVSSTTHDLPTIAGFWAGRDIDARRSAGNVADEAHISGRSAERRDEKSEMLDAFGAKACCPHPFPAEAADWTELTGEIPQRRHRLSGLAPPRC